VSLNRFRRGFSSFFIPYRPRLSPPFPSWTPPLLLPLLLFLLRPAPSLHAAAAKHPPQRLSLPPSLPPSPRRP